MQVFDLTPRLAAEVEAFANVLAQVPDDALMGLFESPPPKQTMPQQWHEQPGGEA